MYVLLFVNENNMPGYLQGSMEEINSQFAELWKTGEIDKDDWDDFPKWELLGIEDGRLTPMANVECFILPQFEVY